MDNDRINEYAKYYVENNVTIKDVADNFDVSKSTVQKGFRELKDINPELLERVNQKRESNQVSGRVKGGNIGKRTVSFTKELANEIAKEMCNKQLTYEEASEIYDIASSTLYEMMHSEYIEEQYKIKLASVAKANKIGVSTEQIEESNKNNGK